MKSLAMLAALLLSATAQANYSCVGPVDVVALDPGGNVTVTSTAAGLSWVNICQIGGTANGVGSDQCKAIYAELLTARAAGQTVQWWFGDALTCTTHPSWQWLTGWYFGPAVV